MSGKTESDPNDIGLTAPEDLFTYPHDNPNDLTFSGVHFDVTLDVQRIKDSPHDTVSNTDSDWRVSNTATLVHELADLIYHMDHLSSYEDIGKKRIIANNDIKAADAVLSDKTASEDAKKTELIKKQAALESKKEADASEKILYDDSEKFAQRYETYYFEQKDAPADDR